MTKNIKLIGITGRKFNGKDTLGNIFVNNYNYKKISFACALKKACKCIFGFSDEQLYGDKKEEIDKYWNESPRVILQYVGTDLFRNQFEKNIWIKVIEKQILNEWSVNENTCFVITDVRFSNEIDMIKKLGGIVFRIKRNNINNTLDNHDSENQIDKLIVDYEILNNGTINELYEKIQIIL